jgi:hypothetical protein
VPRSIEDVDNFQRDSKAQHIGADVLQVVQGDKNAVVSTFVDMQTTPPPVPPEQPPQALPAPEAAPATAALNLGTGAVAPLQPEHTDVSRYTNEADAKLKEEGVTQEQLDMVDSGDLANANQEKKGLAAAAKTEPQAVQQLARQQTTQVAAALQQDEKRERGALAAKRQAGLGAAALKQKGAKSALEKKRDEVAGKINGIYQAAQTQVTQRLAALEKQAMRRFDAGNAQATRAFEAGVQGELEAFKDDRYSGWFGWARKAKDWLKGMDDLPGVKAIFERNRARFVSTIEALVADISAENKRVVQECRDELARARQQIQTYVDSLGPSLKDIGRQAAGEVNRQLDEMDGFIRKKEAELQQKLADRQQAAIKAIDDKIEKMKEAMAGALAKLGKLLLWAAKKFFTWALGKFGYSLSDIESIISRGAAVLKAIFTQPIAFVKNLMRAAILGFENFGKNFLTHLKDALFEWLTGSLQGLVLPRTWDLRGIASVALQMIGISYQNLRRVMVEVMGEKVVLGLEAGFALVKTLVTEGPMAAWEQLKDMASDMTETFLAAVKDFIKWKIVEEATKWVLSLLIPGAGIVKAIIGIYDTVVFFIQKAKQIATMVGDFLGAIGKIAAGDIGSAAAALEAGLARGLSLVISFLAALLRLNGITAKIRDAIQKIRGKVDAVLLKVVRWIADKAKTVLRNLAGKALGGDPNATPQQRLDKGLREGTEAVNRLSGNRVGLALINPALAVVRTRHAMRSLEAVPVGGVWHVQGEVNPKGKLPTVKQVDGAGLPGTTFKSRITYAGVNTQGFGRRMTAEQLGPDMASPGQNHVADGRYADLRAIIGARQSRYRIGHLLNNHIGGSGADWHNLTPLSPSGNGLHYNRAEREIKPIVLGGGWVYYQVIPRYNGHAALPAGAHPAEAKFATSLDIEWQPLAINGTTLQRTGQLKTVPVDNALPD